MVKSGGATAVAQHDQVPAEAVQCRFRWPRPRGVEESSRSGPAPPRADRSDTLPRDNFRNGDDLRLPNTCASGRGVLLPVCGTALAVTGEQTGPSRLTPMESFESFVALALEDEGLVVSEAVKFRVKQRSSKASHEETRHTGLRSTSWVRAPIGWC